MKSNLLKQKVEYQIQSFDGLVLFCYLNSYYSKKNYFTIELVSVKFKVNKVCRHQHWLQAQCLSTKLDLF